MKKTSGIFIALFIVTTGIFGWLYQKERSDAEKWRRVEESAGRYIDSTFRITKSINDSLGSGKALTSNPFTSPEIAKKYIDNFAKNITDSQTTSLWINFGVIADLVRMNEDSEHANKIDGVRVYFAKYPKLNSADNEDPVRTDNGRYDDKNTIVVVATKADGTNHKNVFNKRGTITINGVKLETYEGLHNYHDLCPNGTFPPCQAFTVIP